MAKDRQDPIFQKGKFPAVVLKGATSGKQSHSNLDLLAGHKESRPQDTGLPLVPVLFAFQVPERICPSCGLGILLVAFYFIRFHLKENLMGALMGKGEPPLSAQLSDLARLDKAFIQNDLVFL